MLGRRAIWVWLVLAFFGAFLFRVLYSSTGWITIGEVLNSIFTGEDFTIRQLRLPRAAGCVVVGLSLGLAGSALQSLFRNPLADPYVAGVSSGAAVGGAVAAVCGFSGWLDSFGMVTLSLAGGGLALFLVVMLARHRGVLVPERLLLAGVMVGSLLSALLSLILLAAGQDTGRVLRWLLGSMTPMYWDKVALMAVALLAGGTVLVLQTKKLNVLALGTDAARRVGINSNRLAFTVMAGTTLLVSITVGVVGIVGFLGLVAPHIARRLVGTDWRGSLIASGLIGSAVLCLADIVAQKVLGGGGEAPVGIVTAVIGAPFLLILLRRE